MSEQRSSGAPRPIPRLAAAGLVAAGLVGAACATQSHGRPGWGAEQVEGERRCQRGDAGACGRLGRWLVESRSDENSLDAGLVLLEEACGLDDLPACTALGGVYERGFRSGAPRAHARAKELLGRACARGAAPACTLLGEALRDASPGDDREASRLFSQACRLGDNRGCELFGLAQWQDGLTGDKRLAEEAFALACGRGLRSSCHWLGATRLREPARRAAGVELLSDNCAHDYVPSCVSLALLVAPLVSRQPDCAKAAPWAERACGGREPIGCAIRDACGLESPSGREAALARLRDACERKVGFACLYWADGRAADASSRDDADRLTAAYERACRDDSTAAEVACARVAGRELAAARTAAAAERPLFWLRSSCDRASAEACCALADALRTGAWVTADPAKAAELRARSCEQGCDRCCHAAEDPAPVK
jgi:TPR repeat protein